MNCESARLIGIGKRARAAEFSFEVKIGYDEDVVLIAWLKPSKLIFTHDSTYELESGAWRKLLKLI